MYTTFLALHSIIRWLFLVVLLFAVFRGYQGWLGKKAFGALDNRLRLMTTSFAHLQLLLGLSLFFMSPVVKQFLDTFPEAMKETELRYFGMEHTVMMILAIVVLTIGSAKSKRRPEDLRKFKTMAIWFTIGLLIVLAAVPWPFSMVARPYFRPF